MEMRHFGSGPRFSHHRLGRTIGITIVAVQVLCVLVAPSQAADAHLLFKAPPAGVTARQMRLQALQTVGDLDAPHVLGFSSATQAVQQQVVEPVIAPAADVLSALQVVTSSNTLPQDLDTRTGILFGSSHNAPSGIASVVRSPIYQTVEEGDTYFVNNRNTIAQTIIQAIQNITTFNTVNIQQTCGNACTQIAAVVANATSNADQLINGLADALTNHHTGSGSGVDSNGPMSSAETAVNAALNGQGGNDVHVGQEAGDNGTQLSTIVTDALTSASQDIQSLSSALQLGE